MTESDAELKTQPHAIPEHWSLYLRCTICFGYLKEPHTLACGHSFCRKCLRRLAEIAKDDNPDLRVRHLNLTCPTCRQPFSARHVLAGRVSTCIILKRLVELWRAECCLLASSSSLAVRSICSQTVEPSPTTAATGALPATDIHLSTRETLPARDNLVATETLPPIGIHLPVTDTLVATDALPATDKLVDNEREIIPQVTSQGNPVSQSQSQSDLHEEFSVRMRPLDQYCQAVMQRVSESTEDLEFDLLQEALHSNKGIDASTGNGSILAQHLAVLGPRHAGSGSDSSTDSDVSSLTELSRRATTGRRAGRLGRGSDNELSSLSSVSMPDLLGRVGFLPEICDVAPARLLLLLAWCSYSVVIVGLVQSFLPYVILFTLFFFLVVLR